MAEPTTPPLLNPSAKQQVLLSADKIRQHRAILDRGGFQESINLALLWYSQRLGMATADSNAAAANMYKLKGAQEFVHQFIYLAEDIRPEVVKSPTGQLDHNA